MTSQTGTQAPTVPEPSRALVREWTACALVRAATRFLPVPVLDDAVADRATRVAVSRTLRAHGRTFSPDDVEPLFGDGGRRGGLVSRTLRTVVLFPVRKYTKVVTAVHGVPNDVARVLLLGRATHRRLALGELVGPDPAQLAREATEVRAAFEEVVDEMDLRLLRGAISDGLGQVKDLTAAVVRSARARSTSDDAAAGPVADPTAASGPQGTPTDDTVAEGTEQVQQALERPEVVRLLEEFDRRMDERLATARR